MGGGTGSSGYLHIPEEINFNRPYDWEKEDWLERMLEIINRPLDPIETFFTEPPVTPMVFKYPDPTNHHCCFAGCDLLPCGCCSRTKTWCPHNVAPYGRMSGVLR